MTTPTPTHKHTLKVAACVALTAALALAALPASSAGLGHIVRRRGPHAMTAAGGPETLLTMLSDILVALHLSDEQKAEIKGILKDHKDSLLAIAAAETHTRAALRGEIRQPAVDAPAVRAASAVVAAVDLRLNQERASIYAEIYAVLTAEQRQQVASFAARIHEAILARVLGLLGERGSLQELLAQRTGPLNLTDEQKAQLAAIIGSHKAEVLSLLLAEQGARATLRAAIHQAQPDEPAVRTASASVAAVDLELALERAQIYSEVYAVLTPQQRAQLAELIAQLEQAAAERIEAILNLVRELF